MICREPLIEQQPYPLHTAILLAHIRHWIHKTLITSLHAGILRQTNLQTTVQQITPPWKTHALHPISPENLHQQQEPTAPAQPPTTGQSKPKEAYSRLHPHNVLRQASIPEKSGLLQAIGIEKVINPTPYGTRHSQNHRHGHIDTHDRYPLGCTHQQTCLTIHRICGCPACHQAFQIHIRLVRLGRIGKQRSSLLTYFPINLRFLRIKRRRRRHQPLRSTSFIGLRCAATFRQTISHPSADLHIGRFYRALIITRISHRL